MQVTFWGTRGSIAKAGPATLRFGGNTSCVSVRSDAGTQIVLDCGTGAHGLGQQLMTEAHGAPVHGHILISHTHWDHIQGLPFFAPMYMPNATVRLYGPRMGHFPSFEAAVDTFHVVTRGAQGLGAG